jgi:hydrogenase nickel incorporation protein HypA/HybF
MHELSIAMSILDVVEQAALERGETQVAAIHLKLGPLSGVVKEALLSAFELARESTPFAECQLLIEQTRLVAFCPVCGMDREIPSVQYLCCPVCDTPTPKIVSGREMDIMAMEVCA